MTNQLKQILTLSALFFLPAIAISFFSEHSTAAEIVSISTSDKNYFEGKTIEWVIPFKEGGGGDTWTKQN